MIDKKIEDITKEDLIELINNQVPENRTLEYKSALTIGQDKEKKEFLADVSSFANCIGGDLIIGIEEDENEKTPINICGISYTNQDELFRQIESIIRDSFSPRILNVQLQIVPVEEKNVLIIRIPQSIIAPHRIEFKEWSRFYTRNNKGKYPMDVNELRLAFNSGIDLSQRIESYKTNRYFDIISNKYNRLENNKPIFVVHYIPLSALNNSISKFSIKDIKQAIQNSNSSAFGNTSFPQITIDGAYIPHSSYEDSYAKFINNGIIEKASTKFFEANFTITSISPSITLNNIYIGDIYSKLINDFNEIKGFYNSLGINTPLMISCAFLNASNYTIPSTRSFHHILGQIDKDILCIDDLYVENIAEQNEIVLKPIFDSIYNACGYEKSPYFDENHT